MLLLVLSDVAKAHTISLAMTMDEDFWSLKWLVKPNFKCSMTPWLSFNFFRWCKYFGTHSHNTKFAKNFSTTIPLKEIEYPFKNSKMNKDIILADLTLRLWTCHWLSRLEHVVVASATRMHVCSFASYVARNFIWRCQQFYCHSLLYALLFFYIINVCILLFWCALWSTIIKNPMCTFIFANKLHF
jgi:hypothetical protein